MGNYTSDYERCPVDGARLRDNKCSACGFLRKGARKERVIVDGKVYDRDKVPQATGMPDPVCSVCGVPTLERSGLIANAWYCEQHMGVGHQRVGRAPLICPACGKVSGSAVGHASHMRAEARKAAVPA